MRVSSPFLPALCALMVLACRMPGATTVGVNTIDPVHLSIKAQTPFSVLPPTGYAQVDVTILNHLGQRGTWAFSFDSETPGRDSLKSDFTLSVEDGSERTARFVVPLAWPGRSYTGLRFQVHGPGVLDQNYVFPSGTPNGAAPMRFLGIGEGLATAVADFQFWRTQGSWSTFSGRGAAGGLASHLRPGRPVAHGQRVARALSRTTRHAAGVAGTRGAPGALRDGSAASGAGGRFRQRAAAAAGGCGHRLGGSGAGRRSPA